MRLLILDTNVLVEHWRRSRIGRLDRFTTRDARSWAERLIELHATDAIVTPIYLEFICGARDARELVLIEEYLAAFRVVDRWDIRANDWKDAHRIARRVPLGTHPKPRDLGDCLIRAIARRLRYKVHTADLGFPRDDNPIKETP
jgi:predicted nucleic acid-binding protein